MDDQEQTTEQGEELFTGDTIGPQFAVALKKFIQQNIGSLVTVTDASLLTSDITTNDVSTSKHGFAPKAPNDSTKFLNGVGSWATPASNLSQATGTDTATLNTHSGGATHTITHALGTRPKIITVTTQLNPAGVPGASFNQGAGVGTIVLDGFGNIIGGFNISVLTGTPAGSFSYNGFQALVSSIGASSTTTGGTSNMTLTVNNVTATTFDLVYSVSDNGGAGAPTQNFSASWAVLA